MMTVATLLAVFIASVTILIIGYTLSHREHLPTFRGLCLFDIDGTLTAGQENEAVVQYCLDQGYAVGIVTAGQMYNPTNLLSWSWMPRNLYQFMAERGFDSFNNVASGMLDGEYDPERYECAFAAKPPNVFWPGWLKGFAMESAAAKFKVPKRDVVLFDNDPTFLDGVERYDKDLKAVCAGPPCGSPLTLARVKQVLG